MPPLLDVLLVDDHPVVRAGLAALINAEPDFRVCGEAGSAEEALELVARLEPQIALIDISLPGRNGIDLVKDLKLRAPGLRTLVVSSHDESLYGERALRAGASGYVDKMEAAECVVEAIRVVHAGGLFASERLLGSMGCSTEAGTDSILATLTNRELQVFEMLGQGSGTRQIATTLNLSVKTIETYRSRIKSKLNLRNASELVKHAVEWVNVSPPERVDRSVLARERSLPIEAGERYWICSPLLEGPCGLVLNERYLVGRAKEANIRIKANRVSREHAELVWSAAGLTLRDLGSTNGTQVNGLLLESKGPVFLDAGDQLLVAEYRLRVVASDTTPVVDLTADTDRLVTAGSSGAATHSGD